MSEDELCKICESNHDRLYDVQSLEATSIEGRHAVPLAAMACKTHKAQYRMTLSKYS